MSKTTTKAPAVRKQQYAMMGRPPADLVYPEKWSDKFTPSDRINTNYVIDWMNKNGWGQTQICRLSANVVNVGTLNQILKGKYTGNVSKHLAVIMDALNRYDDRSRISNVPWVETSVYKLVKAACHRAQVYKSISVINGVVGCGKTSALKEYAAAHPSVIMIEADPEMTPIVLLSDLVTITGAVVQGADKRRRGTKNDMFRAVVHTLKGSDRVIILDEAETVQEKCIEYLRRIRDLAEIGIVLSGTEYLKSMIDMPRGQFHQSRSRAPYCPPTIRGITRSDTDAIFKAGLEDHKDNIDKVLLDTVWAYTQGSVRMLTEALIPAIKDYGLNKGHPLSPELIREIGKSVLTLEPAAMGVDQK